MKEEHTPSHAERAALKYLNDMVADMGQDDDDDPCATTATRGQGKGKAAATRKRQHDANNNKRKVPHTHTHTPLHWASGPQGAFADPVPWLGGVGVGRGG